MGLIYKRVVQSNSVLDESEIGTTTLIAHFETAQKRCSVTGCIILHIKCNVVQVNMIDIG